MSETPAPRRRLGCIGWLCIIAGAILLLLLATMMWLRSDADLRRVHERARAMGVPRDWGELALVLTPAEPLARWRRLMQLAEGVKSYVDSHDAPTRSWPGPRPGTGVPDELRAHHATLPAGDRDELLRLCDGLAPDSITTRVEFDASTPMPDVSPCRHLVRLLCERVVLAEPAAVADEVERAWRAAAAVKPRTLMEFLVLDSQAALLRDAIAARLGDLPEAERARLGEWCDRAVAHLDAVEGDVWVGEFLGVQATIAAGMRTPAAALAGSGMPTGSAMTLPMRMMLRAGRERTLGVFLDAIAAVRANADPRARQAAFAAIESSASGGPGWWPSAPLVRLIIPALARVEQSAAKARLGLALLGCELRRAPWPADPFDPAGGPMRKIERGGTVIGAYSVGDDGRDDGGSIREDWCWALRDRLGKGKAADPP